MVKMKRVLLAATVSSTIGSFNMDNIMLLKGMGYEVHVACNFKDTSVWPIEKMYEFLRTLKSADVRYHQVDFSRNPFNKKMLKKSFWQFTHLLTKYEFDFVHCHTPIASVITRVCCHKKKIKVIYTAHGFHFYKGSPLKNWLLFYPIEYILSYWTDLLITITREDYKRAKRKFHPKRVSYIPGVGVNCSVFQHESQINMDQKNSLLGVHSGHVIVISVGELNKNKNHQAVINAIGQMDDPHKNRIHYFVAGEGEEKNRLIALAKELKVKFHPLGYRNDIAQLLAVSDIFVLPSIREGINMSLMEAMSSGKACIVSDIRGNRDLVDNKRCLFNAKDADMLSQRMLYMISNDGFRRQQEEKNREKIKVFDQKYVNKKMMRLYEYIGKL